MRTDRTDATLPRPAARAHAAHAEAPAADAFATLLGAAKGDGARPHDRARSDGARPHDRANGDASRPRDRAQGDAPPRGRALGHPERHDMGRRAKGEPFAAEAPALPVGTADPAVPADPAAAALPVGGADAAASAPPAVPADPAVDAGPAVGAGSAVPADTAALAVPALSTDPAAPADPAALAVPAAPAVPADPAAPTDSAAPADPAARVAAVAASAPKAATATASQSDPGPDPALPASAAADEPARNVPGTVLAPPAADEPARNVPGTVLAAPAPAVPQAPAGDAGAQQQPAPRDYQPRPAQPAAAPAAQDAAPPVAAAAPVAPQPAAPVQPQHPVTPLPHRSTPLHRAPQAVAQLLQVATERGISRAKLQLRPADLGGIEIRLQTSSAGVTAQVVADSPEAARMLAQAADDLRRSLERHDVTLLSLDVSTTGDDRFENAGRTAADLADERAAQAGRFHGRPERESAEPAAPASDPTPATTVQLPSGLLVDVLA